MNNITVNKQIAACIADARKTSTWLAYRKASRQIDQLCQSCDGVMHTNLKVAFVSSFTVDPLVDFVRVETAAESIGLQTYPASYGQVNQEILNPKSNLYAFSPDVTFLIAEADTLAPEPQDAADALIALARAYKEATAGTLVLCTFVASPGWPLHIIHDEHQMRLHQANDRIGEVFHDDPQIQICDLYELAGYYGYVNAFSPQLQAMARIPFAEGFLQLLARKLLSYLKLHTGRMYKCLVLDCDNTLWGGIVGEDGIDGIALGPDWPGREFVTFQKAILQLYEQGIILAINSKNNEADVMQVLHEHPHSVLKEEHFAVICINWSPKPDNMKSIAKELNIGLDSLVFVDDNPVEREQMRQMLPETAILDLPENPALYAKTLRETNFFARAALTEEDKQRGRMYADQRRRSHLEKTTVSLNDYLKSLEMVCTIRAAEDRDVKRAAQLTQRTNQFNLTTHRYTEDDIRSMIRSPEWNVYVLSLKDKFGDNGTVGLALVQRQNDTWRIDTFLMSCRVIGRQAEDALADRICMDTAAAGANILEAEYIQTQKNALVSDFWDKMGFEKQTSDKNKIRYALKLNSYTPKVFEYLTFE